MPGPVEEGGLELGWGTGGGFLIVFCGAPGAAEGQGEWSRKVRLWAHQPASARAGPLSSVLQIGS